MLAQMKQTRTLSILLVEDDPRFRAALRSLLGGGYTIVGEASSVETAISLTARRHPDLMLLDMKLEDGDGIAVLQQLQERQEKVKPLVLSAHQEGSWIHRAMLAGAQGYLFKPQVAQQLENAITTVSQGNIFLPPNAATPFIQWYRAVRPTCTTPAETPQLSSGERELLELLVSGCFTNQALADRLHITISAVKARFERLADKLQVEHNRVQVILQALRLGLIQLK